jgi:hypothetical protein
LAWDQSLPAERVRECVATHLEFRNGSISARIAFQVSPFEPRC